MSTFLHYLNSGFGVGLGFALGIAVGAFLSRMATKEGRAEMSAEMREFQEMTQARLRENGVEFARIAVAIERLVAASERRERR